MGYEFSPIEFDDMGNIRDSVFSILRNAILDGKLEPGQRLVERRIAEQLKISRTPVREAIRQLQLEGLVIYIPRKGVIVSEFDKESIKEIQLIRAVLEALGCSIAAEKISDKELEHLNAIVKQMSDGSHKNDSVKLSSLNGKFHECIRKAANSPRLYGMTSTLSEYVDKFTRLTYTSASRIEEAIAEHNKIIDALSKHDSSAAHDVMKIHVEKSARVFLEMAYPDENK